MTSKDQYGNTAEKLITDEGTKKIYDDEMFNYNNLINMYNDYSTKFNNMMTPERVETLKKLYNNIVTQGEDIAKLERELKFKTNDADNDRNDLKTKHDFELQTLNENMNDPLLKYLKSKDEPIFPKPINIQEHYDNSRKSRLQRQHELQLSLDKGEYNTQQRLLAQLQHREYVRAGNAQLTHIAKRGENMIFPQNPIYNSGIGTV